MMNGLKWNPWSEDLPGAASLLEQIDKRIFVWLRDGRMYVGTLRTVDQFANLVMSESFLRVQFGNDYGDIPQGILMIRGENVALLGEEKERKECKYSAEQLLAIQGYLDNRQKEIDDLKSLAYWKRGLIFTPDDYF
ncbi:U6 snRNA-associated Sm-like protein LSm1 [Parasteatoda tepidariorum]|uniref:U6 snRNA-associated Sm-like protein LSm1 n=1 Tax=Parasteatoda tepidariorum TaxID=114398 RepID=UPI001C727366|nr:U6 snRNA-associated Sm-like protein LSm1 [Parasteatoda tepidariorum]